MLLYPAIDLKNGKVVRLYQGKMDKETIFDDHPAARALSFQKQGFKFLHLVDLDAATNNITANETMIKEIISSITIPAQLGGGIRSMAAIEKWLNLGLARVIIGTAAVQNPQLVKDAAKNFPEKIIVGIDARNHIVATHGWTQNSTINVIDLAKTFEDIGLAAIIYTDINRDGTMVGADIAGAKKLAENISIPVIISGGIESMEDIKKIKAIENSGVCGAIVGRALYEGKITAI